MKLLKPTYLLRTLLLLCAVAVVSSACERNETQSLSDKLDHMIANRTARRSSVSPNCGIC